MKWYRSRPYRDNPAASRLAERGADLLHPPLLRADRRDFAVPRPRARPAEDDGVAGRGSEQQAGPDFHPHPRDVEPVRIEAGEHRLGAREARPAGVALARPREHLERLVVEVD